MTQITCPKCGEEVPLKKMCEKCGASLAAQVKEVEDEEQQAEEQCRKQQEAAEAARRQTEKKQRENINIVVRGVIRFFSVAVSFIGGVVGFVIGIAGYLINEWKNR